MKRKELKYLFIASVLINAGIIFTRILYTKDIYSAFLAWNLFLGAIPLFISQTLIHCRFVKGKSLLIFLPLWLLFIPNAPYLITDFVHLSHRPPVPLWYDLFMLLFSSLNGLILGFISIGQVESIIQKYMLGINRVYFRVFIVMAMSYGVYIGRYLRFNSWDVIINPLDLSRSMYHSINAGTIGFVIVFGFFNLIFYSFFRTILAYRSQEVS
jgi:uncharacterized membrane protein